MTTIIGIAGNQIIQSVEVFNGNHVTYTPQGFVTAIQNAGGLPIVLPIGEEKMRPHIFLKSISYY